MTEPIDAQALETLFLQARTHFAWQDKPVSEATLRRLYDVARMGPTSANCSPMRLVFVVSREAKARLKPALIESNVDKTMSAPVTAIIGHDMAFYDHLPKLFPHANARSWFAGPDKTQAAAVTAFRNGSLQGAYLILAARALGLDCGPMSGFDNEMVDREFFSDARVKSNFLCNLGYGDASKLFPRSPRFEFDEVCRIL
jgi:3-hydroxypropanoate dehydrogenase